MQQTYLIWDFPLRLFHWLLVISLIAAYVTSSLGGLWLSWHIQIGLFILSLIVFRISWGFLGSTYSRFSSFFLARYCLKTDRISPQEKMGHTPQGSLAVITMLGLIMVQAATGLFALNDEIEIHGYLYALVSSSWSERLTFWHLQNINLLLFFAGLHVIAIAYYTWMKQCNLLTPMLTGKIHLPKTVVVEPFYGGGIIAFLISIGLTVLVIWAIIDKKFHHWLINWIS